MKRVAHIALQGRTHVFQHSHMRKHCRNLERPHDTPARSLRRLLRRDVGAIERDGAATGVQELGQQIEERGLAGTVGANQGVDVAALDLQVHLVDGNESLEFLGQLASFKNNFR